MLAYLTSSLRRELQSRLVFRWSILLELISTATMLGVFFIIDRYHANVFGEQFAAALANLNTTYFGYVSLNLAVATLSSMGLSGLLTQLGQERSLQSFEYIMASPITIRRWAVVSGAANLVRALTQFVIIFGVAVAILRLHVPRFSIPTAMLTLTASIIPLWSLSLLTLSSSLVFRRGDPLGFLLGMGFELLGGVYAPLDVLPRPLQLCGECLPITPAIRAMQAIVYHGARVPDVLPQLLQLGALTAIYLPLALGAIGLADKISRRKGYYCFS